MKIMIMSMRWTKSLMKKEERLVIDGVQGELCETVTEANIY